MAKTENKTSFNPDAVTIKRALTLPVLSMKVPKEAEKTTIYFCIAGTIASKQDIDKKTNKPKTDSEGNIKEVHTVTVINMMDNRPYTVVLSAVMYGILTEDYDNDGYIGKCFQATSRGKINGKDYNTIDMVEIDSQGNDYIGIAKGFGVYEPQLSYRDRLAKEMKESEKRLGQAGEPGQTD